MAATTTLLGLVTPTQGTLSGTWGDTVNYGISDYVDIAIAGTLSFAGDGAITLANTLGSASGNGITTTTAQYMVIRVTGTLTTPKIITGPSYSKLYMVDNSATGSTVSFIRAGQTPAVSIAVGEKAFVYYNGTDYVKVSSSVADGVTTIDFGSTGLTPNTATSGAVSVAGTLAVANGGTGITSLGAGIATFLGTPSSANLAAALTDETGSGSAVFATSPTLVTPALGTPTALVLTSATGLPLSSGVTGILPVANGGTATATPSLVQGTGVTITGTWPNQTINATGTGGTVTSVDVSGGTTGLTTSGGPISTSGTITLAGTLAVANGGTGITSLGAGVATFLGTPSSANLASAVTDETGSGSLVFATSPTLVTPVLGTPSSGTLSSCTVDGTNKVGYLNIPNSGAKTTSYTLAIGDVGKFIELGTGGSVVVPASVFAAGDAISIFNNTGSSISCTCSAITDFYKGGTDADISTFSVTTRGVATILFITATRAVVTGNLV
jgi:hypothetical protein